MAQPSATYLVVESAGQDHGRRIDLVGNRLTIGRLPTCDVRFDDLQVSRTHATVWRRGDADYVEDLGSSGGTYVNNVVITGPRELRAGDTVAFAGLRLRYSADGSEDPRPRQESQQVRYDIREQRADEINNVGRDQFNYSQHIVQQRESFFREIAATKTKARWLVWTGVALFVIGLGIAYVGGFNYLQWFADVWSSSTASSTAPELDFSGLLIAAVGGLINTVGVLLVIIGIVLHIVATSRRKRVNRDFPPPPPQYRRH
ncbi:FHA domain-containing protein [Kribbella kalugense]|uniref:FHA domain-containing protein n=1 Tax=Kribbella kalugense TaxID=2512221 RepID=A0A4R7ZYP0_9ACTN|nr:FHA domain-containing protein [Kribbella kalugense]TDW22068.1 FHA domain-containing protein [Kribbella kalugense]